MNNFIGKLLIFGWVKIVVMVYLGSKLLIFYGIKIVFMVYFGINY